MITKVNKNNPLALYYQIKEIIKEMIENYDLKPGDAIPTEREICEEQGISRMTVNKAIIELVNEGILYREQGKGTFVAYPKKEQPVTQLKGFTEYMQQMGVSVKTEILSFKIKKANKQVIEKLGLEGKDDNKVIEVVRVRYRENEPLAIETAYLPHCLFPDMTKEKIEGQSLYSILRENYGCILDSAKQTIEPIVLSDTEAGILKQPSKALALMFKRNTYDNNNLPIEYTKAIYRSDKYKYEVFLK